MTGRNLRRLPAALLRAWLRDPAARARLSPWLRTLRAGVDPVEEATPLVTYAALDWLEAHVGPDVKVFEWGSGASTIWLARRVAQLVTVENDPEWHRRVAAALKEQGLASCQLILAEAEPAGPDTPPEWVSPRRRFQGLSFERYVRSIDPHPEGHFDLVCVDGRQRVACARRAVAHVRPGGHLLLDNADRSRYDALREALAAYPVQDFDGLGPFQAKPWRTTVWQIA